MPTTEAGMDRLFASITLPHSDDPLRRMRAVTDVDVSPMDEPLDADEWREALRYVESTEIKAGPRYLRTTLFWIDDNGDEVIGRLDVTGPEHYSKALRYQLAEIAALWRELRNLGEQARMLMTAMATETDMRELVVHTTAPDDGD